ncbi:hypothetical protein C7M84_002131 [Penaeus vannamei]|uniref:Uncharacterized protein n=1 Tax=Penaeus vannamei TaxID=6689 RepID=A0A3R7QHK6_PENVA|nr:hypothetical protein C7M84_002131 [Penaeus vannamei]
MTFGGRFWWIPDPFIENWAFFLRQDSPLPLILAPLSHPLHHHPPLPHPPLPPLTLHSASRSHPPLPHLVASSHSPSPSLLHPISPSSLILHPHLPHSPPCRPPAISFVLLALSLHSPLPSPSFTSRPLPHLHSPLSRHLHSHPLEPPPPPHMHYYRTYLSLLHSISPHRSSLISTAHSYRSPPLPHPLRASLPLSLILHCAACSSSSKSSDPCSLIASPILPLLSLHPPPLSRILSSSAPLPHTLPTLLSSPHLLEVLFSSLLQSCHVSFSPSSKRPVSLKSGYPSSPLHLYPTLNLPHPPPISYILSSCPPLRRITRTSRLRISLISHSHLIILALPSDPSIIPTTAPAILILHAPSPLPSSSAPSSLQSSTQSSSIPASLILHPPLPSSSTPSSHPLPPFPILSLPAPPLPHPPVHLRSSSNPTPHPLRHPPSLLPPSRLTSQS